MTFKLGMLLRGATLPLCIAAQHSELAFFSALGLELERELKQRARRQSNLSVTALRASKLPHHHRRRRQRNEVEKLNPSLEGAESAGASKDCSARI